MKAKKQSIQLSSPVFMWIAFGFSVLAMLMMFVPCVYIEGKPLAAWTIFFYGPTGPGGAWPSFMGYMFIVIAGLIVAFTALPFFQPSRKLEMRLLFIAEILFITGIILVMLILQFYCAINGLSGVGYYLMAGTWLTFAFGLISVIATGVAIKLDW